MSTVSPDRVRDRLLSSLWVVPAACAMNAMFPGPAGGGRSVPGSIISAMIAFTGLVSRSRRVVLTLTSSQFSPASCAASSVTG